jgi:hypothetical protein
MESTERNADNTAPVSVVAEALDLKKRAGEFRERAIKELLNQRRQIDANLKALDYDDTEDDRTPQAILQPLEAAERNGPGHKLNGHAKSAATVTSKRFRNMSLADIARILLHEHQTLHGTEIEEMAKAGGFQSAMENLQNYLPVALRRVGGFRNIGKNTWRLDASVEPKT